jgi:hypothetical protein
MNLVQSVDTAASTQEQLHNGLEAFLGGYTYRRASATSVVVHLSTCLK